MRISDWSSDVCSSDLSFAIHQYMVSFLMRSHDMTLGTAATVMGVVIGGIGIVSTLAVGPIVDRARRRFPRIRTWLPAAGMAWRSEEHTSELQSLMRISYAGFCLNKKTSKPRTNCPQDV